MHTNKQLAALATLAATLAATATATAFYACHALSFNISCAQNAAAAAAAAGCGRQQAAGSTRLEETQARFVLVAKCQREAGRSSGEGVGGYELIGDWLPIAKRTETVANCSVAATFLFSLAIKLEFQLNITALLYVSIARGGPKGNEGEQEIICITFDENHKELMN